MFQSFCLASPTHSTILSRIHSQNLFLHLGFRVLLLHRYSRTELKSFSSIFSSHQSPFCICCTVLMFSNSVFLPISKSPFAVFYSVFFKLCLQIPNILLYCFTLSPHSHIISLSTSIYILFMFKLKNNSIYIYNLMH